jgi:hypothetical protein
MPTAAVLLPIQGLSLIFWWIAGSYLGVDTYSSRSFPGADEWCTTVSQGLGSHCWGDYYYVLIVVFSQSDPWTGEYQSAGPAASFIPFMAISALGTIIGFGHAGLIIFLGSMTLLIGWSVWVGTKGIQLEPRLILFTTLTLFSPPLLSTLDRGNSVGFIIPLLLWLYLSLRNQSQNQSVLAIVLLTIVKPHFAVLLILFLIRGQIKTFTKGALMGGMIHILAFLVVAGDRFPVNIYDWLTALVSYQDYTSVNSGWPQNISFAQALYTLANFFRGEQSTNNVLDFIVTNQGLVGPIVLLTVVVTITTFRKILNDVQVTIILTSLIVMTSSTSFYYYSVFSIPALLALTQIHMQRKKISPSVDSEETSTANRIDIILWSALVLTLIQLPMYELDSTPANIGLNEVVIVTSANLTGGFWILAYILIFAVLLGGRAKKKTKTKP